MASRGSSTIALQVNWGTHVSGNNRPAVDIRCPHSNHRPIVDRRIGADQARPHVEAPRQSESKEQTESRTRPSMENQRLNSAQEKIDRRSPADTHSCCREELRWAVPDFSLPRFSAGACFHPRMNANGDQQQVKGYRHEAAHPDGVRFRTLRLRRRKRWNRCNRCQTASRAS